MSKTIATENVNGLMEILEALTCLKWVGTLEKPTEFMPYFKHILVKENGSMFQRKEVNNDESLLSVGLFINYCVSKFPKQPEIEKDPDGNEGNIYRDSKFYFVKSYDKDGELGWCGKPMNSSIEAIEEWNKVMKAYRISVEREEVERGR